ncbi:DUF134 domain-containing protein [Oceanispirochaeta crateris]|uniref:DUF134 domain-containing protein n=1 Tax=Oceanispirochaeta crateris TaxID=2518645 RepID=A0A5C1QSC4_9SPIO|nr:DUF134 domain-containing protein [Oceanispirochaeta crateris]QEN09486.1 DUF134 domain-containing protein [Oceanispirochaeta crateris]
MGRNEIVRSVNSPPRFFRFNAEDSPTSQKKPIELHLDEYEALRLADKLNYDHKDASRIMNISRPTFTRLLNRARKKAADFLTDGGPLEIAGGRILFASNVYCCKTCHRPFQVEPGEAISCPRCNGNQVIKAQPSCQHDCRCCEESDA